MGKEGVGRVFRRDGLHWSRTGVLAGGACIPGVCAVCVCECVCVCVCVCVHGVCSIALNSNVTPAAPTAFVAARLFHDCAKVSCTHEAAVGRTEDGRGVGRIFNVGDLRRNS